MEKTDVVVISGNVELVTIEPDILTSRALRPTKFGYGSENRFGYRTANRDIGRGWRGGGGGIDVGRAIGGVVEEMGTGL